MKAEERHQWTAVEMRDITVIFGDDGDEVARVRGFLAEGVTSWQQANLILRAVNNHQPLIEALEMAMDLIRVSLSRANRAWLHVKDMRTINRVLAAAKGEG